MDSRRRQAVTDRFTVQASDGRRFDVVETTTYLSVRDLSGSWHPEQVQQVALHTGSTPVNPTGPGWYEVLTVPPTRCARL